MFPKNTNKPVAAYLWVLVPIVLMTVGQTLSKTGAVKISLEGGWINWFLIGGYALLILRGIVWIFIVRAVKLVFAYPLMSLTYVLVLIISATVFEEAVTWNNVFGSACIIAGVTLLSLGERRLKGRSDG